MLGTDWGSIVWFIHPHAFASGGILNTGESHSQAVFFSEGKATLLECVFVQPAANHIPLGSNTIGNHLVDIDGSSVKIQSA